MKPKQNHKSQSAYYINEPVKTVFKLRIKF